MVSPPTSGAAVILRIDIKAGLFWKVRSVCHSSAIPPVDAASSKIFGCFTFGLLICGCPSNSPNNSPKATCSSIVSSWSGKNRTLCSESIALNSCTSSFETFFKSKSLISAPMVVESFEIFVKRLINLS